MIQQNTPEWLEMRKSKLGASDAPVIMKVSPYKTPYQLWQEKLGLTEEREQNAAMQRGHNLEHLARTDLELKLGMPLIPSVKVHKERSWMMASLDALSFDETLAAEIKCPGKEDHAIAQAGEVPQKYFPQLQHQLEVCELEMIHYFSFDGEDGVIVQVYRDDKYIKQMLKEEEKFYECMQNFEAPALTDKDYQQIHSDEWIQLADEWKRVSSALHDMEQKEKELKQELITLCNGQSSIGAGIKVSHCVRRGAVDYASIPDLKRMDLEPYRKKSTEYWRITS
jgi:putative phage-type endonuclease